MFWSTILNFYFPLFLLYCLFYLKAGKNIYARAAATGKQVQVNPICSSTVMFLLVKVLQWGLLNNLADIYVDCLVPLRRQEPCNYYA